MASVPSKTSAADDHPVTLKLNKTDSLNTLNTYFSTVEPMLDLTKKL